MKGKISDIEFTTLIKELSNTPLCTQEEIDIRARGYKHFLVIQKNDSHALIGSELIHYSTKNKKLNEIVNKLTNRETKDIVALHTIEMNPPCETKSHIDLISYLTLNILLEDNFEGGDFYLNGKKTEGMRSKGEYIMYNGGKEQHAVSQITKGTRKSLIVWYDNPNKNLI